MSRFKNIWDKLSALRARAAAFLRQFGKDLKEKLYEGLVKNTANLILLILFVAAGGYIIYDVIEKYQEERQSYEERCFRGIVINGQTGLPVADVNVGIQGKDEWKGSTNEEGVFEICINIHEEIKEVALTFYKSGYVVEEYPREAVPQNQKAEEYAKVYVINPVVYSLEK